MAVQLGRSRDTGQYSLLTSSSPAHMPFLLFSRPTCGGWGVKEGVLRRPASATKPPILSHPARLLPELGQILPVGRQIIVQNPLGHLYVGDHRVQKQALERSPAVAVDRRIHAQPDHRNLAPA